MATRSYQISQLEETYVGTCVSSTLGIVGIAGSAEQDVQGFAVCWLFRPPDFRRCPLEIGEHAFAHWLGRELTHAGDEAVVGGPKHVQLVSSVLPLADVVKLPVNDIGDYSLAEPFE